MSRRENRNMNYFGIVVILLVGFVEVGSYYLILRYYRVSHNFHT